VVKSGWGGEGAGGRKDPKKKKGKTWEPRRGGGKDYQREKKNNGRGGKEKRLEKKVAPEGKRDKQKAKTTVSGANETKKPHRPKGK